MQTPGCRFTWFPRLLLLELFASVRFRLWRLPLPLLLFSSCACLVSSETAASRMLTVALAPDSERTFALRAHPFFGTVAWCLFKSLLFPSSLPGVVMTFLVCLPRAPALRQVLVAMLAEGTLESPSVLVLAFHSSLFLVEGSSDGSAPGDRFLSPGRMCSFTPFRLRSVASALSLLGSRLFFLL